MIEEFMLAANISVAEKILKHFPLCSLLRYTFVRFLSSHPDHVKIAHIQFSKKEELRTSKDTLTFLKSHWKYPPHCVHRNEQIW
jgi:hypothetical protein